ncbi:MAG: M23 family metallopeptidase [Patescibacteria group bacterium]
MAFLKFPRFRGKRQTYSQLKFSGLKLNNRGLFSLFGFISFLRALFNYLWLKTLSLGSGTGVLIKGFFYIGHSLKAFIIRKLIWSRGKLGRPVANLAILAVAFLVFLTGGVFGGSQFVNSAPISPDYLKNEDDFIPDSTIATTALPEGRRLESIIHEVKGGETLTSIGQLYKISVDALRYVNNLTDEDFLRVGQKLTIPPIQGVIYKVKSGDTCDSVGKRFDVAAQAILDFNYLDSCATLVVGKELVIPDAKVPAPIPVVPSVPSLPRYNNLVDVSPSLGWCIWPTSVRIITQYFSYYHNGLDIATPWSLVPPIYACGEGTVTRAGWDPFGLGLHIVIDHGNGYSTVYGHMRKLNVSVGQDVNKGQVIGLMGSTGRSTGPHLHFIIKYKGVPQNPLRYVK